jgi:hypothetical protein
LVKLWVGAKIWMAWRVMSAGFGASVWSCAISHQARMKSAPR